MMNRGRTTGLPSSLMGSPAQGASPLPASLQRPQTTGRGLPSSLTQSPGMGQAPMGGAPSSGGATGPAGWGSDFNMMAEALSNHMMDLQPPYERGMSEKMYAQNRSMRDGFTPEQMALGAPRQAPGSGGGGEEAGGPYNPLTRPEFAYLDDYYRSPGYVNRNQNAGAQRPQAGGLPLSLLARS